MDSEIKISRDGKGAVVNWAFLAAFAAFVWGGAWWLSALKATVDQHGDALARIENKLDDALGIPHTRRLTKN